jgi:hypothetical protein
MAVGCPAAQDNSQNADGRCSGDDQDADVDFGHVEIGSQRHHGDAVNELYT